MYSNNSLVCFTNIRRAKIVRSFTFLGSYHHEESPGYTYLVEHKEQDSLLTFILYYISIYFVVVYA